MGKTYNLGMYEQAIRDLSMLVDRGGYVMIPLLILSIVSVSLIFERCWFWYSVEGRDSMRRLEQLNAVLRDGDLEAGKKIANQDASPYGAFEWRPGVRHQPQFPAPLHAPGLRHPSNNAKKHPPLFECQ